MALTNAYTTLANVKSALRITDTVDDALIEIAINSASRMIDGYCEREFYQSGTVSRYFAADSELLVQIDDVAGTAITVATDPNAQGVFDLVWTPANYQLEPLNGNLAGQTWPYTRIRAALNYLFPVMNDLALVKVTGVFGWPSIPNDVELACILQSERLFKRFDSPTGVVGFGDLGAIRVSRQMDPDVAQLLNPYARNQIGLA